ncbi:MAG: hypothetical protein M3O30_09615 [Planctomycetota bacterium]|nr:hypothetical protein [Planctomycetota bacterium]
MQSIFGGAALFFGITCLAIPWAGDLNEFVARIPNAGSGLPIYPGLTLEQSLRLAMTVDGALLAVLGLTLLSLTYFVYRGGLISTIASLAVNGLVIMVLVAQIVNAIFVLRGMPGMSMQAVLGLIVGAWCIRTAMALWAAMRAAYQIRAMRLTQANQYWTFPHGNGGNFPYQTASGNQGMGFLQPPDNFTPPSR